MKKNLFIFMAVLGAFFALNANIFAEDYYVLYKDNAVTQLFAGNAIDSVKPDSKTAAANLSFYTADVPETVALPDSVVFKNITDLSPTEKANCYIVPSAGTYMFDTELRDGTLKSGAAADYVWTDVEYIGFSADGVEITGNLFTAAPVKEIQAKSPQNENWVIKDIQYLPALNKIMFTATGNIGNALIALYNEGEGGARTIVWSWHIWATGATTEQMSVEWKSKMLTTYDQYPVVWLDRNLGALTTVNVDNLLINGFHYEWGRKDPFPTARVLGTAAGVSETSSFSQSMPMKVNPAFATGFAYLGTANTGTVEDRIATPTVFVRNAQGSDHWANDMGTTSSNSTDAARQMWGDGDAPFGANYKEWEAGTNAVENYTNGARPAALTKSKYDPCPVGYRVPTAEQMFLSFAVNKVTTAKTPENTDPFWANTSTAASTTTNGKRWSCPAPNNNVSTRMAASGTRFGSGNLISFGSSAYYWTATTSGTANGAYCWIVGGDPRTEGTGIFGSGRPVRCVKEVPPTE